MVAGNLTTPSPSGLNESSTSKFTMANLITFRPFGLHGSALLEMILFFGLALGIDHFFLSGNRYWDLAPHPFWLIILLISAQYGTSDRLFAAIMSGAALLIGNLPVQSIYLDLYSYLFELSYRPMMWVTAAVIFGELRMRQARRAIQLANDLKDASHRADVVASAYKSVDEAKQELEIRVAGQLRTVFSIHRAAKAIEKAGTGDVLLGVTDLVRGVLSPKKFSIYLLKDGILEAGINQGWMLEDGYPRTIEATDVLFQEVIGRQRFLCSAYPEEARALGSQGVFAGPLMSAENGEVIGMLKVEDLDFLDLNLTTIDNFRILCDWIGTAYSNARIAEEERTGVYLNADRTLMSTSFFDRQTAFLSALAQRVGFDVSLLILGVEDAEHMSEDANKLVATALNAAVTRHLRTTDLAFDYQRRNLEYALVLPATPLANVHVVADKIMNEIRDHLPPEVANLKFTTTASALYEQSSAKPRQPVASQAPSVQ
jgi:polysaccharide biosynthesis protein PelD